MTGKGGMLIASSIGTMELRVYDCNDNEVASGVNLVHASLPPGIYRVLGRNCSQHVERLVDIEEEQVANLDLVGSLDDRYQWLENAILYYGGETTSRTRIMLLCEWDENATSRWPVVIRTDSAQDWEVNFGPAELEPRGYGFRAFSLNAEPGHHEMLQFVPGYGWRGRVIHVEPGWETRVVARWNGFPDFQNALITYAREGAAFNGEYLPMPLKNLLEHVELALIGLMQNRLSMDRGLLDMVVRREHEDPMFAMIAAYALLAHGEVDRGLMDALSSILLEQMPNCPDVTLIHWLANAHLSADTPVFATPPMFAAGTEYLIKLASSHDYHDLVAGRAPHLLETIMRMVAGSPWTAWDEDLTVDQAIAAIFRLATTYFHEREKWVADDLTLLELADALQLPVSLVRLAVDAFVEQENQASTAQSDIDQATDWSQAEEKSYGRVIGAYEQGQKEVNTSKVEEQKKFKSMGG